MKKSLSLILACCFLACSLVLVCTAGEGNTNVFTYQNGKENVIENDGLSYAEKELNADYIAGVEEDAGNNASPCEIACLFGHDLIITEATEITHNVYSTSPKCELKVYEVKYCKRSSCDYITKELKYVERIADCHG